MPRARLAEPDAGPECCRLGRALSAASATDPLLDGAAAVVLGFSFLVAPRGASKEGPAALASSSDYRWPTLSWDVIAARTSFFGGLGTGWTLATSDDFARLARLIRLGEARSGRRSFACNSSFL